MNQIAKCLSVVALALTLGGAGEAIAQQSASPAEISKRAYGLFTQGKMDEAVQAWKRVQNSDLAANFYLGYAYQTGSGVKKDLRMAVAYYTRAADNGHAAAALNRGEMLAKGEGVTAPNASKALDYMWKSARGGLKQAQVRMAEIFDEGYGDIKADDVMAHKIYSQLYDETREPCYALRLARMFRDGEGVPQSGVRARQLYRELAVKQEELPAIALTAREEMGMMQYEGKGLAQNFVSAEDDFVKAYEQGSILASRMLGIIYQKGLSYEPDLQKAYDHYQRAVEAKDPESMYWTALLLSRGELEPNYLRARELLKEAGRRGLPEAYVELGRLYKDTDVFGQTDPITAWVWYTRALETLQSGITRNTSETAVVTLERGFGPAEKAEAKSQLEREVRNDRLAEVAERRGGTDESAQPLTRNVCDKLPTQ
ncbi:MAG: hypothetical protein Alpg2KO_28700 [Alphaproteobacteria bacterium]